MKQSSHLPPCARGWSVSSCRRGSAKMSSRREGRAKRWSSEIRRARRPTCPTSRRLRKRPKPSPRPPYVTLLAGAAAGPEQITRRLFTDAWEIIHISAHGVSNQLVAGPDGKKTRRTGIVLGGGAVLDPSALAKIPVSPAIVFINCCHLGVGPINLEGRPEFAANVAIELVKLGARCVIAGWAIDDDVAAEFGKAFYEAMLNGETFGKATLYQLHWIH